MYVATRPHSELLAQANAHTIDQHSPDWWDVQGVRMEIKVVKGGHCDPAVGNGPRQQHLYGTARPSAGYSHEQTQTRVAITHKARVPKLHAMCREGGGAPLRVRPPPRIWQCLTGAMASAAGRDPPGRITNSCRHMLAKGIPHANSALVRKGDAHINPHSPQYAGKYDSMCKFRSGTGRGAHINQHLPQYAGK